MVNTRAKHPPAIATPNFSNLYKLNFVFDDEKILKDDPFVDAITNFFAEADELNKNVKALIAERTKKKVPTTPKKKIAAMTLVRNQIEELRKINFDDEEDTSFDIPPIPSPRRPSPKKPVTSQKRHAGGDAYSSPVPGSSNSAHTPARGPFSHSNFTPVNGLASSRIVKAIVPKAATVKEKDPNLIDKLRLKAETAEERRKKQIHETQERLRKEHEEKEKKNRERKQQIEEEARRKFEATKLKEAKMKEFEEMQREEARPLASATTTPKKDRKPKEILTPRQAHIPPKKGKDVPQKHHDFEITSPVRKHKKPTPPKEKASEELFKDDEEEENQMADEEDNGQQLNYVEITADEAEADIRSKSGKHGRALSSGDIPNHSRASSDINETPKKTRLSDVSKAIHFNNEKFKAPAKIFNDVIQDSINESAVQYNPPVEQVVKTEPMEEDEYENDENVVPMQQDVNKSSYDMTVDKIYLPSTETNYNVDDLSSNDETDDEAQPRKTVPNWAKKHELNVHVKKMLKNHSTVERINYFGSIQPPSLKVLFNISDNRRHRNSSAVWQSPLHQPTEGKSRLPVRR